MHSTPPRLEDWVRSSFLVIILILVILTYTYYMNIIIDAII